MLEIAPTRVQDLALGLFELHEGHMGPLMASLSLILSIAPLSFVSPANLLRVHSAAKLAEGALNPTVYVIDEDIKKYWFQYGPLRDPSCYWFPLVITGNRDELCYIV